MHLYAATVDFDQYTVTRSRLERGMVQKREGLRLCNILHHALSDDVVDADLLAACGLPKASPSAFGSAHI